MSGLVPTQVKEIQKALEASIERINVAICANQVEFMHLVRLAQQGNQEKPTISPIVAKEDPQGPEETNTSEHILNLDVKPKNNPSEEEEEEDSE